MTDDDYTGADDGGWYANQLNNWLDDEERIKREKMLEIGLATIDRINRFPGE
jgi:hypothetical protein